MAIADSSDVRFKATLRLIVGIVLAFHAVSEDDMSVLRDDIAAFDAVKADLEAQHFGEWAVFYAGALAFLRGSFDEAAGEALERFEEGPYLIRQVGASAVNLPASVMYRPAHG